MSNEIVASLRATPAIQNLIKALAARGWHEVPDRSGSEWSVAQFQNQYGRVVTLWVNRLGHLTWPRDLVDALDRTPTVRMPNQHKKVTPPNDRDRVRRKLINRDGSDCWLCGEHMPPTDRTIEHLLSRCHGGSNHLANLVLTHGVCNQALGNKPLVEKIRMQLNVRQQHLQIRQRGTPALLAPGD